MSPSDVSIAPVSAATRGRCEALTIRPDQRSFVVPVAGYLALCETSEWEPVAVLRAGEVVGFAMWAYDAEEDSHWLGGLLVDRRHQRQGVGRAAVTALMGSLAEAREFALSYEAANAAARSLYRSLGFRETGERTEEGEVVARRPAR